LNQPVLFNQYALWLQDLFCNIGFGKDLLMQTLEVMKEALKFHMPEDASNLTSSYIDEAIDNLRQDNNDDRPLIDEKMPLYDIACEYLEHLLGNRRNDACGLILKEIEDGISIKDIYLYVFEPCQKEIGRLWLSGKVSVAQEHFCTAITQMIMTRIYPQIFTGEQKKHKAISTCVEGELHEIGLRMVTDLLELDGWNTCYLGANTPGQSIVKLLEEQNPDILLISTTMTIHVDKVADLISAVRRSRSQNGLKIMTGGMPFNISPDLYKTVGADGYAGNAAEAVLIAGRLINKI
jgi:methanogenic corrinoid protein MtbC1